MSTHQTAKTQFAAHPNGTTFAYRRLGTSSGTPLLVLTHFRGVMDKFDPLVLNGLAARRAVITVDYAGVGQSTGGRVATSVAESADDIILFLGLIGLSEVDILGFSLGGMVAQLVALNADPAKLKVRKLILGGTAPSAGAGVQGSPNAENVGRIAGSAEVTLEGFKTLFFPKTREGDAAAEQWWVRIHERSEKTSGEKPAGWLSQGYADGAVGLKAHVSQLSGWATPDQSVGREGSFERLKGLGIPVFVANGHADRRQDDYMVPTVNSFVLQQQVPNGQLVVYPGSGHGFLFQFADLFVQHALLFLEA
ncbi:alpha/beta-hydrolase [Echria macrotheca]|uniref:Alpha/beta-hydrolase n=1 Tax=Echria macrotheca TaxID=438768 RepID=A0AAJ0FCD5_9PEZI|nr:alpha/beta-hydrolase [Echria macrotheca]